MSGGQFSHFRDKMSLARDTGHRGSIPGRSRPFRDGWQAYTCPNINPANYSTCFPFCRPGSSMDYGRHYEGLICHHFFFNSSVTCTQEQQLGFALFRVCQMCFTQHQDSGVRQGCILTLRFFLLCN